MTERLVFSQTVEGLLRAVGEDLDAPLKARLQRLGLDPTAPLLPAYPQAVFADALRAVAEALFPGEAAHEQEHRVGLRFMDGYAATFIGRAMVPMMRLIGPGRTLQRLSRQFRTGNNYSETKVSELGPGHYELWCSHVSSPGWYEGLLERGLELAGGRDVRVHLTRHDGEGATFDITWRS